MCTHHALLAAAPGFHTTVVHQDQRVLVADKPAGLLCVPGRGPAGADNLATRLQAQWPDALVVHRLDMATSGLVLFGRGAAAQRALSIAFAQRQVHKRYEAVVAGLLADDSGEIQLPLGPDWPNRPRQQVDHSTGKASHTRWQVLSRDATAGTTRLALAAADRPHPPAASAPGRHRPPDPGGRAVRPGAGVGGCTAPAAACLPSGLAGRTGRACV